MIERLLIEILNLSVTGALSITVFCTLSLTYGKKCRAKSRKYGWILIAASLLLPVGFIKLPFAHTIQMPNLVIKENGNINTNDNGNLETDTIESKGNSDMYFNATQGKVKNTGLTTEKILFPFWLAGMLILTVYHVFSYHYMLRRLKRYSHSCNDESVKQMAEDISIELGLRKFPSLQILEASECAPFTIGITKSTIFLPDEKWNEDDLYYILKHELVHCREKDILWKLLFLTVDTIHWFNPFVWLMHKLAANDIELACDESVLKNATAQERSGYCDIIMSWVEKNNPHKTPLSTEYMAGTFFLKQRFSNALDNGAKSKGAFFLIGMIIIISIFSELINIAKSETIYKKGNIPIDFGIEVRTDLDGDDNEDRVIVTDSEQYTTLTAYTHGNKNVIAGKTYDGAHSSLIVTGDLSGNGRADILMRRAVYSNHGIVEISILHLENNAWIEYPYNFIHNPNISIEQPISFESNESWENGDMYVCATIFEKNGKTMARFILYLPDFSDKDTVKVVDASYRKDGWYIENVEIVRNFYQKNMDKYIQTEYNAVFK